jgi:Tol biopolymer transport system component
VEKEFIDLVAFASDERRALAHSFMLPSILILDLDTGKVTRELGRNREGWQRAVAVCPDGLALLIAGGNDGGMVLRKWP